MKRTFGKVKVTNPQSTSLSDAPLRRPYRRYTTADTWPAVRCGRPVRTPPDPGWFPFGPP